MLIAPIFIISFFLIDNPIFMNLLQLNDVNIFIGNEEVFPELSDLISKKKYSRIFILVDENTLQFCLPVLINNCPLLKDAEILETESGEQSKNIEICVQLWNVLSEMTADRNALIVNLGGGVICDLGGFVASLYKRGIDFINVPTTLLAQVDAAIGNKTGIDLNNLKNQIGLFASPQGVFVYPHFLRTLGKKQILSGFSEALKHALISDKDYWKKLKKIKLANSDLEEIVIESIKIKKDIVEADPLEKGKRKILNFGHTIGHAIETLFMEEGKELLLHGEAIAAGIICEAFISYKKEGLDHSELDDICDFIFKKYKPVLINEKSWKRLIEIMQNDKKNKNNQYNFTLLSSIGNAVINRPCSEAMIKEALKFYILRSSILKR
jgi:3-dehydroquinate synthase